jgi:hypothetical protein
MPISSSSLTIAISRKVNGIEFEVLTAVVMTNFIFWDIMPCSRLKVNGRFGETCRLHIQSRRISQARNQLKKVAGNVGSLLTNRAALYSRG